MITVIQSDKPIAVNEQGQKVLGTGYFIGKLRPNYPMPAIRECPWCFSKHVGHSHFITDDGLIVPT